NVLIGVFAGLGLLIAAGYWFWQTRELKKAQETVEQRRSEADKLASIIKEVDGFEKRKASLQERIDLINQLKQNQKGPVRIMDQISRDLPDLVWLDRMTIDSGKITLAGRGLNPNAIANFVENIKKDPYFEEPQVGALNRVSADPAVYSFDMSFSFTYAPKGAEGEAAAPAATGTAATTSAGQ
ncbi:MAG: PilN domain-containing protein, partial [Thermoanaerobaculia bacterium]